MARRNLRSQFSDDISEDSRPIRESKDSEIPDHDKDVFGEIHTEEHDDRSSHSLNRQKGRYDEYRGEDDVSHRQSRKRRRKQKEELAEEDPDQLEE